MKINRRKAMGVIAVTAATTQVGSSQAPAPGARPADDALEAARQDRRNSARIIAAVPLPPSTEPPFHFRA